MNEPNRKTRHVLDTPAFYRIRLRGRLSESLSDRLGGMDITCVEAGPSISETVLSGWLPDQAALAGVLNIVYNYGMAIMSVERSEVGPSPL